MGVLVDIVPNHVGVATPVQNPWWWSLLKEGQQSRYAQAFDVDWDFGGGRDPDPRAGRRTPTSTHFRSRTGSCGTTTTASRSPRAATPQVTPLRTTPARSTTGSTTS